MTLLRPDLEKGAHLRRWQLSAVLLVISSLLAIAFGFISPRNALFAFASICWRR